MTKIDLFTWTTPNGFKPLVMLEELEVPYSVHAVDIGKGKQHEPAYLALNPNGKIPSLRMTDDQGQETQVFESGAILITLGEWSQKYLPPAGQGRADTLAWLMFQMGGIGPMFGQLGHFRSAKPDNAYGIERYTKEAERILGVLESRLAKVPYLADSYSIADMAAHPWVRAASRLGLSLDGWPSVKRWVETIDERPAVKRAYAWKPDAT